MANVTKAVHYILANTAAVTTLVSTRIWRTRADQKSTTFPRIVITRISNIPQSHKDNNNFIFSRVQVSCFATDQKQADALAAVVRTALDRVTNAVKNGIHIAQIDILDEIDLAEDYAGFNGIFQIALDFQVAYNG